MKKQLLSLMAALFVIAGGCLSVTAAESAKAPTPPAVKEIQAKAPEMQKQDCDCPKCKCQDCKCKPGQEHKKFEGQRPPKFGEPGSDKFGPGHKKPSKEEMEARKAAFEKRLNLTEDQKKQIEANRKKDREKMEPVMKKLKTNRDEFIKIKNDTTMSEADKNKKIEKLRKERKELQTKADKYHKENMKKFEALLTPEQKAEFEKIKAEQKAKREKMMNHHQRPDRPDKA